MFYGSQKGIRFADFMLSFELQCYQNVVIMMIINTDDETFPFGYKKWNSKTLRVEISAQVQNLEDNMLKFIQKNTHYWSSAIEFFSMRKQIRMNLFSYWEFT